MRREWENMGRNVKAKRKKTDVRSKYLISDKQLDKIKFEVAREATGKASLLCVCAMADHLHMSEEDICDVAQTITKYAMYLDEHKIRINQIAEIIKNETGIEFSKF